jgi:pimeloyl-ACP methyl ester carboxylesterase
VNIRRDPKWGALKEQFPVGLVDAVQRLFNRGGTFETSARELCAELNCGEGVATQLLEALTPPLDARTVVICRGCGAELPDVGRPLLRCCVCDRNLTEVGGTEQRRTFLFIAPRTRDVSWVLALHGMNTRGGWQEEFNWRVATAYKRSVPVAIYKYGIVRPGVLSQWYLRRLEERVVERIETLQGRSEAQGFQGPPDVIAHSLGTWLIGHALQHHPTLKIGRLLLTGSILRPDFDWQSLRSNGQVQAVLNHYGTKDVWAAIAHYVIPDSGPSGRIGFLQDAPVIQVEAEGFRHSDYFDEQHLPEVFEQTWRPFLTRPAGELSAMSTGPTRNWSSAFWPFRATVLPVLLLILWWLTLLLVPLCIYFGASAILARLGVPELMVLVTSVLICVALSFLLFDS